MAEPNRERVAGIFYTVDDLMSLPEVERVNPEKAQEVSIRLPLRMWISTEALIGMLEESIANVEQNQVSGGPDAEAESEAGAILIAQRRLWIRHLKEHARETGEDDTFIGLFPASEAGEAYDDEAAVREETGEA